jgi:hypothetical protein
LQTSALPLGYAAIPVRIKDEGGKMKQHLARKHHAFVLHPPAFILDFVERETRFELATLALARRCSTTELLPHSKKTAVFKVVDEMYPFLYPSVKHR